MTITEKKGSSAEMGLHDVNDLAVVVLGEGVGSAVLAEGKGFADVSAFRRGLRPPLPPAALVARGTTKPGCGKAQPRGSVLMQV